MCRVPDFQGMQVGKIVSDHYTKREKSWKCTAAESHKSECGCLGRFDPIRLSLSQYRACHQTRHHFLPPLAHPHHFVALAAHLL